MAKAPSFPSVADIKTKDHLLAGKSVWLRKRGKEVLALVSSTSP